MQLDTISIFVRAVWSYQIGDYERKETVSETGWKLFNYFKSQGNT